MLRQIRFYGIATCWRQSWVTRKQVEVRLDGKGAADVDSAMNDFNQHEQIPDVAYIDRPRRGRDSDAQNGRYQDYPLGRAEGDRTDGPGDDIDYGYAGIYR